MAFVFTLTSVITAALLFLVQPMVARMVLPAFGGSPQVWTTAMLFFQTALLAGYGYTHLATNFFNRRAQLWVHLIVLAIPLAFLPIQLTVAPSGTEGIAPSLELLGALTLGVAVPFVVIASSGPLVQRWFSWSGHAWANDPYFLYAAGNIGSIGGLLFYPFLVEPNLSVVQQSRYWMFGYWGAATLLASSAIWVMRSMPEHEAELTKTVSKTPVDWWQIGYWMMLAFIPSSLMLGITSHLSTDVASMPMLWIFPLVAYLLTFTIAFSRYGAPALKLATLVAPAVVVAAIMLRVQVFGTNIAIAIQVVLMLVGGLVAHGKLSENRPAPSQLTRFYLVMSIGGALGGLFNGLVAPLIFPHVFEYGLALTATIALVTSWKDPVVGSEKLTWILWMPLGLILFVIPIIPVMIARDQLESIPASLGGYGLWVALFVVMILMLPMFSSLGRSLVVCLGVGVASLIPQIKEITNSKSIERTFFGVHRVTQEGDLLKLVHGTTAHGQQNMKSLESRSQATTYYHADQPFGDLIGLLSGPAHIGVVGLGAGSIAAYGSKDRPITFLEIDPAVVRIAETQFAYIKDARDRGADIKIELGDGRLTLSRKAGVYDLLAIDAFSSDAIPVHLLTVEAVQVYLNSLKPDGIIGIHISNHYLDLVPVLAGTAKELNLAMLRRRGTKVEGKFEASEWVVIARDPDRIAALKEVNGLEDAGWTELSGRKVVWTDQRSSVWAVRRK
jgi:hypothetical protein